MELRSRLATLPRMRPEYRLEECRAALSRVAGMPFNWSLNPYTGCVHRCTFCYVRAFEQRADRPSGEAYGASIRVKTNIAEMLRRELRRKSWRGESVALGTATDVYQPAEGTFRLTRACIEVLAAAANPFTIITRGPMVVRDIDILQHAASRAEVGVSVSIPTLDLRAWRTTEPGTAPPAQRLRAIRALANAGIHVSVALAPILPGLTDGAENMAEVIAAAREAGAQRLWCRPLNLRPGTREHFLEALARDWPELLPEYRALFPKPYLAPTDDSRIRHTFDEATAGYDAPAIQAIVPAPPQGQLALL